MRNSISSFDVKLVSESIRSEWGWFMALGVAVIVLSVIAFANLALATQATIFYVGALMFIGGIIQVAHLFQVKSWSSFFYFLLSGLFYTAAGVIAYENPFLAAATLTLVIAISLMLSGAFRVWSGFQLKPQAGWGWILASGLTTIIAGLVFAADWPVNTLWLLGIVLAIDLMFQGVSALALGIILRSGRPSSVIFPRSTASAH